MSKSIAETILKQIGGRKFTTMTGAKNLLAHEDGSLSFKLPSNFAKKGINYVKITLDPSDTYTMCFGKIFKHTVKEIITHCNIYDDMLARIFTTETGLDTHL